MLFKPVIACLVITAFAAVIPTSASAFRGAPMQGTYRWPPGAFGTDGGTPGPTCGYIWVNPYPYKPRTRGRWVYQCH